MKKASAHFNAEQRRQIAAAVAQAESRTSAEIVPIVATESGRYDRTEDLVGLVLGVLAMAAVWMLFQGEDPDGGWEAFTPKVSLAWLVVIIGPVGRDSQRLK